MATLVEESLTLRGRDIVVKAGKVPQAELKFYLENPRVYSIVKANREEPTQEDIQETLMKLDHVKHLVRSIEENGGLIDPVIVLGGENIVLEGNCRLAAYRILAEKDAVRWGEIKAKILPRTTDESSIFALLGEYHIIGKKDWAPYEQAGYLYRRHKTHKVPVQVLHNEIGLSTKAISHLINVYQFMIDKNEKDLNRWSYYDEFLKSNKIGKARDEYPELDDLIVDKIRSGEVPRAVDIRDGLKLICEAGGKTLDRFASNKINFEDSVHAAENRGAGDQVLARLKKFRTWIGENTTEEDIMELKGEVRSKTAFELGKIKKRVDILGKKLDNGK